MFTTLHYYGIGSIADVLTDDQDPNQMVDQLSDISLKTQACSVNIYPNFKYHPLLPPTSGLAVKYRLTDRFYADVFRCDRYRVMAMAKLTLTHDSYTTEKGKEFERLIRRCLNYDVVNYPDLKDDATAGWTPSLGNRNTRLGLYHNQEMDTISGTLKTNYYLIVHSCLPEEYLAELCQHDEDVDKGNYLFEAAYANNVNSVDKNLKLVTVKEQFEQGSVNDRAMAIAEANARRMLYVASVILELELETDPVHLGKEYDFIEDTSKTAQFRDSKYLAEALEFYGLGNPIFPFTTLASLNPKIKHGDLPPDHLRGYPLGYFVMRELAKAEKDKFLDKYKINFISEICEAVPLALTTYNCFRFDDYNTLTWLTGVASTGSNVLSDEGLELGYKCHNPQGPISLSSSSSNTNNHGQSDEWKNHADNTIPVAFPKQFQQNRQVVPESLAKFFSLTEGGQSMLQGRVPDCLLKKEINMTLLRTEQALNDFNPRGIPAHYTPVKVFAPNGPEDIWTYRNI